MDTAKDSPSNISNFLDIHDRTLFPEAFANGTITGTYALQHYSDLVRWPLLLRFGGVYADVGFMLIGQLDELWNATLGMGGGRYEVLSFNGGDVNERSLTNYFLASLPGNAFFDRCSRLLLKLWEGRTCTEGLCEHPLLKGIPMMGDDTLEIKEDGKILGPDVVKRMLTDYIIQGQVMSAVMGLVDEEDGWNGPEYVAKHVYAMDFMIGSQYVNQLTAWDGPKAFRLLSLPMPREGVSESDEQKEARNIVEECLQKSFGFKLAHGLIFRVMGDTLGTLWRKHEGSDAVPGTYAAYLRYGIGHWSQRELPPPVDFNMYSPSKFGPLLRES